MLDFSNEKGWSRHSIFGLRREWLELYITDRVGWRARGMLGNRQVDSLAAWLKTTGLEDRRGGLTSLGEQFLLHGLNCRPLWELLWVNVVFNFPTARWYAHLGNGQWSTTELKSLLLSAVPCLAERTASNAVMELAGLLEQTPVGRFLGQGEVSVKKPRLLIRKGGETGDTAIMYALGRLYLLHNRLRFDWEEDLTWPWVVFGCSRQYIWEQLTLFAHPAFQLDEQGITIGIADKEWWQCGNIMTIWQ